MMYKEFGDLAPIDIGVELSAIFYPGDITLRRGDGWVHVTTKIPVSTTIMEVIELLISHNTDENFYCLGLFIGSQTCLHIHFVEGDTPKLVLVKSNIPIDGSLIT
jgi:hypothetical protein